MDEPVPTPHAEAPPSGDWLQDRNDLVVRHLPLVRLIAARLYRTRWSSAVGFDEYVQLGSVGLVEAASRFDPARGAEFSTFATWRISGAILTGLVNSTEQHQQAASRRRMVESRVDLLMGPAEVDATDSVEAALKRIAEAAVGLAVGFMLDGTGMYSDGEGADPVDGYASLATRQARRRLRATVDTLPEQERRVIRDHYLAQQPFNEIAEAMGLSKGRISQIHSRAIERLREALRRDPSTFEA
ncbi:sigma-70 family RNA polymerase sigma factor [Piscinibacter gummiphilus]|uniref:Uncharacterized protein n=1 Tax=Piscinibacter gummiphilus TaxID=946333 RepID=A0A1W6L516_9BURK|nr:sigma-70 family RNA polymerase sigma factor [Piscinibacter gummiphilus]ARN19344.1 hypothetical protein A4W93_05145 [Piscinibacter gummiphilus]ATU64011.1 flagellar biosynthesis protein FliA [Piscinibacter gummiphilus]GLS93029.1 RNA polymerase sigma factor [Piscinibacter gummiphilus]